MRSALILCLFIIFVCCKNEKQAEQEQRIQELEQEIQLQSNEIQKQKQKEASLEAELAIPKQENRLTKSSNQTKNKTIKQEQLGFIKYCNQRFKYCIEYPVNFIPEEESSNKDGRYFYSKDGEANIACWGSLVTEGASTLKNDYQYAIEDGNISYKKLGNNFFVVSGTDNGKIFYRKTVQRKINYFGTANTYILVTYQITYPKSQANQYEYYCSKINKDLK